MPIYKYRTFEEAEKALWNFHPDEVYFTKVAELWNYANKLSPIIYPKGIFKFKNIKEANKQREKFELKNAKKCSNFRERNPQLFTQAQTD